MSTVKLEFDENTTNVCALGDYLLTPEEIRLRGLGSVRHQKKRKLEHGEKAQEKAQEMAHLDAEAKNMARELEKRCSEDRLVPVFVEDLFHEGNACEALANRILISRNQKTGEKHLKIGEEQAFVIALREAFAESEFDFFVNVTEEYLTFKVEKDLKNGLGDNDKVEKENILGRGLVSVPQGHAPTEIRMRKRLVLKAIRSKPKLCAFLEVSSC